jgi:16S rRNA (cytosine967-C5)-methyltransferase
MRPEARLQAAIDVLGLWAVGSAPADEVLAAWGRAHRFAGAKDRAAIAARVYAVFRHYGSLLWRMGNDAPRTLVLGSLAEEGLGVEAIEALFSGAGYGPPPLSVDERARLEASPGTPPPWAQGNYPQWLEHHLREAFGSDFEAEIAALNARAPLDLRVNSLKATREEVLSALIDEGLPAEPCPFAPLGVRLPAGTPVTGLGLYRVGLIEVQDEGSQIASLLCGATPGMCVIDLAAGAGGKTLALAAAMADRGLILACDIEAKRLYELSRRAKRAGVHIVERCLLHDLTGDDDVEPKLARFEGRADLVVVDAPCSGTGAWRRAPDAKWRLSDEKLFAYEAAQRRLLARAAGLLRPGGRLCYITCSVLKSENEAPVEAFLRACPHFRLIPPQKLLQSAGLSLVAQMSPSGLRLSPARHGTDGFFVACLEHGPGG